MGIFAYDREAIPFLEQDLKLDNGIYVVKVDQDGPAAKSGIKKGCIILEVDGKPVNTMLELRCIIYSKNPGDVINITHIERETGKIVTTPITLSEKKGDGLITR
jgi:S1-C subfamily serine protease